MATSELTPARIDHFWSRVSKDGDEGCWLWQGAKTTDGYGQFIVNGQIVGAHRFAYELVKWPIPPGLHMDHLCRTPACVNPSHLEPVTRRENILRGEAPHARNARKTHCKYGHELTPENTHMRQRASGGTERHCRICRRRRYREYVVKRGGR